MKIASACQDFKPFSLDLTCLWAALDADVVMADQVLKFSQIPLDYIGFTNLDIAG